MNRLARIALVALLSGGVAGCGAAEGVDEPRPDGRMVLVSGRDDHGQVAQEEVTAYAGPATMRPVGRIADGTLAHVTEIQGTWLHLVTAEGDPVDGWVDDFFLRGTVHLVGAAPSCRAAVDGRSVEPGLTVVVSGLRGALALVSTADGRERGWASRDTLQELPPQGPDCGEDPPGSSHRH